MYSCTKQLHEKVSFDIPPVVLYVWTHMSLSDLTWAGYAQYLFGFFYPADYSTNFQCFLIGFFPAVRFSSQECGF